ncbi:MAG: membrane dipeptidase [Calditrichaeota bacterium]|nr:MAG: membrane dipeptidase [Calditrichota bacterium]MBL1203869.1 membrane dipeptidase [Calditrichota bacterium]NOG43701.1 membrane dipeptidase [Calditrichota bacterium]
MKQLFLLFIFILISCVSQKQKDGLLIEKAYKLAKQNLIVDTHVDVPYRLHDKMDDISQRTNGGDFDYPRAKKGGLDVPFMSIYIPADYQKKGGAKDIADSLIDMVEKFTKDWPDKFALVRSVAEAKDNFKKGLISLPMGMENGAPIEGNLANVSYFHKRGIRYITLTHSKDNHIGDSSYDTTNTWNGLSPFGKELVEEMNRVGIMIDISHVSDSTFYQVIKISKTPIMASHSSCRKFTPGWERNMNDDMIKTLAQNGGVIQINFGSAFLDSTINKESLKRWGHLDEYLIEHNLDRNNPKVKAYWKKYKKDNPVGWADVSLVADHIDHVVKLVGIDHVGIGSDFDGVGDSLPTGLKDASELPNLIYELLKRGYSDQDIEKICSGNILRVWTAVENYSLNR